MLFRIAVELGWVSEKANLLYLPDSMLNRKNTTKDKTRTSMKQRKSGAGHNLVCNDQGNIGTTLDEECNACELNLRYFCALVGRRVWR